MLSRLNHTVLILCLTQRVVSQFQLLTWKYMEAVSPIVAVTVDKHWLEQSESYFLRKVLYCPSFLTQSHFILPLHFVTCVCMCVRMRVCMCVCVPYICNAKKKLF